MIKKYLLITLNLLFFILPLVGCSSKHPAIELSESTSAESISSEPAESVSSEPAVSETVLEESNSEKQTNESSDEYSLDSDILFEELKLGIDTIEKRKAAVNEMGEDIYWNGVFTSSNYIQLLSCENSPITNKIEDVYDGYTATVVQLTSNYDGHTIPADYILANNKEDNDTIIFIHGAGENRRNNSNLHKLYLDLGYNILAYDQRSSGENEALFCTFGYLEQYDLKQYIEYVDGKITPDKKLLIYAKSQGGITACRVLGSDFGNEKIDAAILDCPVTSMRQMIEPYCYQYVSEEEVDYYLECGDQVLSYFIDGFTMAGSEMTEYMKNTTVPVLILTSKVDKIVDMSMPVSTYDVIPGTKKQLYVSETAYHCGIEVEEPEAYWNTVTEFLSNYIK